jgi:hypothetical protein
MRRLFATLALLPVAACTIATSDQTASPGSEPAGTCRNDSLAQFVGQAASQDLGARMLAASGARTIRWVPKGGVITMEFNPSRLTVQLDGSNRVESANCG